MASGISTYTPSVLPETGAVAQQSESPLLKLLGDRIRLIESRSHVTEAFIRRVTFESTGYYVGLRHVSSPEVQQQERTFGTVGDSLNLSFISAKQTYGEAGLFAKFKGKPLELPPEEKARVYAEYEKSLSEFLESSFLKDVPAKYYPAIKLGSTTLRDMWKGIQNSRFSFVYYPKPGWEPNEEGIHYGIAGHPYDFRPYQGMGKFGSHSIASTALTPLPSLTLDSLGLKEKDLDHVLCTREEDFAWFTLLYTCQREILFQFNGPFQII